MFRINSGRIHHCVCVSNKNKFQCVDALSRDSFCAHALLEHMKSNRGIFQRYAHVNYIVYMTFHRLDSRWNHIQKQTLHIAIRNSSYWPLTHITFAVCIIKIAVGINYSKCCKIFGTCCEFSQSIILTVKKQPSM